MLVFSLWFCVVNKVGLMLTVSSTNVAVEGASISISDGVVRVCSRNLFGRWLIYSSFLLVTLKKFSDWQRLTSPTSFGCGRFQGTYYMNKWHGMNKMHYRHRNVVNFQLYIAFDFQISYYCKRVRYSKPLLW